MSHESVSYEESHRKGWVGWSIDSGNIDGGECGVCMKIQTLYISRLTITKTGVLFGIAEQMFLLKADLVVAQDGFRHHRSVSRN